MEKDRRETRAVRGVRRRDKIVECADREGKKIRKHGGVTLYAEKTEKSRRWKKHRKERAKREYPHEGISPMLELVRWGNTRFDKVENLVNLRCRSRDDYSRLPYNARPCVVNRHWHQDKDEKWEANYVLVCISIHKYMCIYYIYI